MADDSYLFNFYLKALRDALDRHPAWLRLDKIHMIETQGSVTAGLVLYHALFSRLAVELGMKFYIRTQENDPTKFEVWFTMNSPV